MEYVQSKLEERMDLLFAIASSNLLSREEINQYREELKDKLMKAQRQGKTGQDFINVAILDLGLMNRLAFKRKELGYRGNEEAIEDKIINFILATFGNGRKFFGQNLDFILAEIEILQNLKLTAKLKAAIEEALPIHGKTHPDLWLKLITFEKGHGGGENRIREIFTKGVRIHKGYERLYSEWLFYELELVNKEMKRGVLESSAMATKTSQALEICKRIYTEAHLNCVGKGELFYKRFCAIVDPYPWASELRTKIIKDATREKFQLSEQFMTRARLEGNLDFGDYLRIFGSQLDGKSEDIWYESLLELMYEALKRERSPDLTLANMSETLRLCKKACQASKMKKNSFEIWLKLVQLYDNKFRKAAKIGENYTSYNDIMLAFRQKYPENVNAIVGGGLVDLSQEREDTQFTIKLGEILGSLKGINCPREEFDKGVQSLCLGIILRSGCFIQRRVTGKAVERVFAELGTKLSSKMFDHILNVYILQRLSGYFIQDPQWNLKVLRRLYETYSPHFRHKAFEAMVQVEEHNTLNDRIPDPIKFEAVQAVYEHWIRVFGTSKKPWLEYLYFHMKNLGECFTEDAYQKVYQRALTSLSGEEKEEFLKGELSLQNDREMPKGI